MEKLIITTIKTALNMPCYWSFADESAETPFVVLQWVGGSGQLFYDHLTVGGYDRRLQIAVWSESSIQSNEAMRTIEQNLMMFPNITAIGAPVDDYDAEIGVYGSRLDFTVLT